MLDAAALSKTALADEDLEFFVTYSDLQAVSKFAVVFVTAEGQRVRAECTIDAPRYGR
ncbi:MAG: hypothetical protein KDB73_02485 [Planctomycetes bacterium]|nr:hypothetical protein [Planctomycetota bacterium]